MSPLRGSFFWEVKGKLRGSKREVKGKLKEVKGKLKGS